MICLVTKLVGPLGAAYLGIHLGRAILMIVRRERLVESQLRSGVQCVKLSSLSSARRKGKEEYSSCYDKRDI